MSKRYQSLRIRPKLQDAIIIQYGENINKKNGNMQKKTKCTIAYWEVKELRSDTII